MGLLTLPVIIVTGIFIAVALGLAAQRLLGIRLGLTRLVLTGVFAMSVFPLIMTRLIPFPIGPDGGPTEAMPEYAEESFWFVVLAAACTLLASMAFIVIIEAFVPLGSIPPAMVWGRGLRARVRRARRYWQIVGLAMRHGLAPYVRGRRGRALDAPTGRAQLGRSLRTTLNAGGVTFVKIGQLMATRPDVFPPEITTQLAKLQDDADPVPWADIEAVLVAELGAPVDDVFAAFDRTPLAAASVGQVHLARLHSGQEVVVKVQRPGIRPVVERDLDIAARLAGRLEDGTGWGRSLGVRALSDGLGEAIREELDYRIEAENILAVTRAQHAAPGAPFSAAGLFAAAADRSAASTEKHASANPTTASTEKHASAGVHIPQPHLALCTERVLVMDRLHGTPLNAAGPAITRLGVDPQQLARTLLDCLLRQIVVDGVFHADPHGGNVFLLEDGTLGLIDFGSVGRLDGSLRDALQRLLLGVDQSDPLAVSDALLELVPRPDEIDEQQLERDLGRFMARYVGSPTTSGVRMFGALFRIVAHHGLAIPPEIAAVFRTLATVEGTLTHLAPRFELVNETRSLAAGYVSEQFGPERLKQSATDELATLLPILRRLPRRIERIANAAEHGRLGFNIRLLADDRDRATLNAMLHEVIVAFLAATSGIMAVLLLGTEGGPTVTDQVSLYELFGYNLLVISAILALRALAQIFRRSS